ncbi:hypothetical protein AK830_g3851 [Neonectria ditissima]|uniref:Dienelactone hydrolase domain-containing protein n=1 Tax=Neonectria ditissima TaxID=78410 RepID=A0A0P7BH86_9HYPO|nr:hypothetical protein AK830_g3851 [Neonectria ditissima]
MSCPDCFKGSVHDYASPVGSETTIFGVRTYVAGVPGQRPSSSTIIFITDVFGLNLVNNKLLADHFAVATGIRVLIPDLVPGGGVPVACLSLMEDLTRPTKWWDIRGHISKLVSLIQFIPHFFPVIRGTDAAFVKYLTYARAVRAELPDGGKLGVAGYCWGGKQTSRLSKEPSLEGGKEPLVDAHYTAHPSSLKMPDDILNSTRQFKVPFSMAVGDRDFAVSKEQVAELEARLRVEFGSGDGEGGYHYEVRLYEGCEHGFACRANRAKVFEDKSANMAASQAIDFFKKWLL